MKTKQWIKHLEKHQKAIGIERDKLRETIGEMEDLADSCQDAYDNIQYAIDRLSELT